MTALTRNDRPGRYPDSWYAATAELPDTPRAQLRGRVTADICIVGAGYAGLTAALTLRARGYNVVLLEAHRAGFGASGRNGGQMSSGYNKPMSWIADRLGPDAARALWDLAQEAKDLTRAQVAQYAPEARLTPGVAHGAHSATELRDAQQEAEDLHSRYGYEIDILPLADFADLVRSPRYHGGSLDRGAAHLHPLRYVLGLARAAEAAGVQIFERSAVHHITHGTPATVQTPMGAVTADHVILAGNGYLPNLDRKVAARTMPINSFIAATAPLPDPQAVLRDDIAVADSKFVVNYFRLTEDNRLLFGGRESYGIGFPKDISTRLRARMEHLFPQVSGIELSHVWGGTLGITRSRLPCLIRCAPNVLSVGGFSGHGVALSALSGQIAAEAVAGQAERFDLMATLPTAPFPGGTALRAPLLSAAMSWFSLRDRLGL